MVKKVNNSLKYLKLELESKERKIEPGKLNEVKCKVTGEHIDWLPRPKEKYLKNAK